MVNQSSLPYDSAYVQFVMHFNAGDYGEAIRFLTEAWQLEMTDTFYKGLIQLTGALEHWHDKNYFWAEDLLASAHNLLERHAPECDGMDVESLLADVRAYHSVVQSLRAKKAKTSRRDKNSETDPSVPPSSSPLSQAPLHVLAPIQLKVRGISTSD